MNNKVLFAIELLWISLAVTCLIISIRIIILGEDRLFIFLGLMVVSTLMAWIRHRMRKK